MLGVPRADNYKHAWCACLSLYLQACDCCLLLCCMGCPAFLQGLSSLGGYLLGFWMGLKLL
jgi:hypothetical protein